MSEKGGMRYTLPSLEICFYQGKKKESTYKNKGKTKEGDKTMREDIRCFFGERWGKKRRRITLLLEFCTF